MGQHPEMSHNRSQTYNERGAGRNSPSPTKRKRFLSLPGLNVAKASKPQWSEQVLNVWNVLFQTFNHILLYIATVVQGLLQYVIISLNGLFSEAFKY